MRAISRRAGKPDEQSLVRFGDLTIDLAAKTVTPRTGPQPGTGTAAGTGDSVVADEAGPATRASGSPRPNGTCWRCCSATPASCSPSTSSSPRPGVRGIRMPPEPPAAYDQAPPQAGTRSLPPAHDTPRNQRRLPRPDGPAAVDTPTGPSPGGVGYPEAQPAAHHVLRVRLIGLAAPFSAKTTIRSGARQTRSGVPLLSRSVPVTTAWLRTPQPKLTVSCTPVTHTSVGRAGLRHVRRPRYPQPGLPSASSLPTRPGRPRVSCGRGGPAHPAAAGRAAGWEGRPGR